MTMQISKDQIKTLYKYLESKNFSFEERPHQIFLARANGIVINTYINGKIVFGGKNNPLIEEIREFLISIGAKDIEKKKYPPIDISEARIGTDEVGKGDYFGPLVIGGVIIRENKEEKISALGIKDSKTLSETTVSNLAIKVREILDKSEYEVIWISPIKYNILYNDLGNLNKILGWGHARAIENLLNGGKDCKVAIADQFGDQSYIEKALMKKGRRIRLIQVPHAERDLAVSTASILAREKFNQLFQKMCNSYGLRFPKGASNVLEFGKELIKNYGIDILNNVAKVHFSTTQQIVGDLTPKIDKKIKIDLKLPKDENQKEIEDTRLECFSLITGFERDLRIFIENELKEYYGDSWWEQGIDENIRKKCEKLARQEMNKGREIKPVDCLSFSHYNYILTLKENWKNIFSKVFSDKRTLLGRLQILKNVRDPAAHARGTFSISEKLEVISTIRKLLNLMNRQQSLDSYEIKIN
jgi:ribonuclease HIII